MWSTDFSRRSRTRVRLTLATNPWDWLYILVWLTKSSFAWACVPLYLFIELCCESDPWRLLLLLLYTACINKPVYRQHFTQVFTILSHFFLLACVILSLLTWYLWKILFIYLFVSWSCHSSATGAMKRNPQLCDLRTSRLEAIQTNWRRHSRLCFCCCGIW